MVKNHGYLSPPLDGIWMRAPFLHNGSVPNLRQLLEPENLRSKRFYRGFDLYDPANVGFVVEGGDAQLEGWLHDTTLRGNGNGGHTFGIDLAASDKEALLEYLKTK